MYVATHPEFLERYAPHLTRLGGSAGGSGAAFETLVQGRPAQWDVVATFTRDVQVQSRGLRTLTLYRLR